VSRAFITFPLTASSPWFGFIFLHGSERRLGEHRLVLLLQLVEMRVIQLVVKDLFNNSLALKCVDLGFLTLRPVRY
jgi:hypothetical protein